MKEVIVLLALASAATTGIKYDGLRVKFGKSDTGTDKEYFFSIPRTTSDAETAGWRRTERSGPMRELLMYCLPGRMVCPLYFNDSAGFVAGLQIAAPLESIPVELKPEEYFQRWSAAAAGAEPAREYWTATQYYVSEESLRAGASATRENGSTLQNGGVWVQGLDGKLMKIQLLEAELNRTDFKKQNCVRNMGTHYYLNMTRKLKCDKQMLPWFPLVKEGKVLGVGFQTFGKKPIIDAETRKTQRDWYEDLPTERNAPLHAIALAPECFLDLSQAHGRLSIHVYYINEPWELRCEPGDSVAPDNSSSLSHSAALIFSSALYLIKNGSNFS